MIDEGARTACDDLVWKNWLIILTGNLNCLYDT